MPPSFCRGSLGRPAILTVIVWAVPTFAAPRKVTIHGRMLLVDGVPVHLKGVNWNPVPKGKTHPEGLDFAGSVERDAELMQRAGIDTIRTYESIRDRKVLDVLQRRGISVLNTVWSNADEPLHDIARRVAAVKDHPAILMWVVGNEWNYNGCYKQLSHSACLSYIREAAILAKRHDPDRPVATVYGRLPKPEVLGQLSVIDVWGVNYYHGLAFRDEGLGGTGDLFLEWRRLSERPLFIGEYGADAWDSLRGREDGAAQARAVAALSQKIMDHSTLRSGVCLGGFVFSFNDEWWKAGNPWVHDAVGFDWGGGPHPDFRYNEEWWGLVDVDRSPREAYYAYKDVKAPVSHAQRFENSTARAAATVGAGACTGPRPPGSRRRLRGGPLRG
mmetsp:Transcript_75715/g.234325  ORF Transcript_75715/g.234325 Transcript_75715/m.234325 type:complete len:387 (-) Transcript_75715:52-1212(-)